MKKQNLKADSMDIPSKISTKKFLQQRINKIDMSSSILDADISVMTARKM